MKFGFQKLSNYLLVVLFVSNVQSFPVENVTSGGIPVSLASEKSKQERQALLHSSPSKET